MRDIAVHCALFLVVVVVIVTMSAMYSESDDRAALASLPRRFLVFLLGCSVLAGIMLVVEHTFASIH